MLNALLQRKTGRTRIHEALQRAASGLEGYEDPLTSSLFERLSYLEVAHAWSLLCTSAEVLAGSTPPTELPSTPPQWRFWPGLRDGKRRVEPDVLLEVDSVRAIFEVKHRDTHELEQWRREVRAVRAALPTVRIWLFAVGSSPIRGKLDRVLEAGASGVLYVDWNRLFDILNASQQHAAPRDLRILQDCLRILAQFGYRQTTSVADLGQYPPVHATDFPQLEFQ